MRTLPILLSLTFAFTTGCGSDTPKDIDPNHGDARMEGTEPGDCTDGADNDGDTFFDCNDDGCAGAPDCVDTDADADTGSDADLVPGVGPGPVCDSLPERDCSGDASYCRELIAYDPRLGVGYDDYALNGETSTNQYRSYARRDQVMLVKYAAAFVDCKANDWSGGNGHPIGLGDMSEANGDMPGSSEGSPGHPEGTHEDGNDIDIAYFQNTGDDNYLRAVCEHTSGGQDQYHCVGEPDLLDLWRNALFIGSLIDSPVTRVLGVDGKIGPLVDSAIQVLCEDGWFPGTDCTDLGGGLAYETTDEGVGWFMFHHQNMHLSLHN